MASRTAMAASCRKQQSAISWFQTSQLAAAIGKKEWVISAESNALMSAILEMLDIAGRLRGPRRKGAVLQIARYRIWLLDESSSAVWR